jgi:translation initiation factor IF-3
MNEMITAPQVRVIDQFGKQVGVIPTSEALAQAEAEGKDLILIADKAVPPVAKLIELSKFRYQEQQKKQEEAKKTSKGSEMKELRLTPFIAAGDLEARIARVREFLEDGNKVRLQVKFRGREVTKPEFGQQVLKKIFDAVEDVGKVETQPKLTGKFMSAQLMPGGKKKIIATP